MSESRQTPHILPTPDGAGVDLSLVSSVEITLTGRRVVFHRVVSTVSFETVKEAAEYLESAKRAVKAHGWMGTAR